MKETPLFVNSEINPIENDIPGLVTAEERDMITRVTSDFRLKGQIVEAGSFFGSSTKAFVEGLKLNEQITSDHKKGRVHVYDKFEYGHWVHPRFIPRGTLEKGESFQHYFEENMRDELEYLTLHVGDITEVDSWKFGQIDILFLDICKTPKINDAVQNRFFSSLVPGSILIQQDYIASTLNIWLYAAMKRLSNCFEIEEFCSVNSVVFRCIKTPDASDLENAAACNMSHTERLDLSEQVLAEWETIDARAAEQIQYAMLHYRKAVAMNRYGIRPVRSDISEPHRTEFAPKLPF